MTRLIIACLLLSGCAGFEMKRMARGAAGPIGCPAEEIVISEDNHNPGTRVYAATCKGRKFYCTEHPFNPNQLTTCAPALEAAAKP